MSKIRIKYFGPVKEGQKENDGWIDVKKVTIFIGSQGSGKSTIAKTISTLVWLEKSINRGDTNKDNISFAKFKEFFKYQKIYNYFSRNTFIEYLGEKYHIIYDTTKDYPNIREIDNDGYLVPKIMYIPAERNLLSTIGGAYDIKGLPDSVFTFAEELKKAQKELNGKKLQLPISNYTYEYDENEDSSFVLGSGYRINILEASSGLQSYIPLFLVSRNLSMSISDDEEKLRKNMSVTQSIRMNEEITKLMFNKSILDSNKNIEIEKIRRRYYNKCFLNIVEEPEQNLYPTSQWEMLLSLLKFNNLNKGNKLILTTHSPYIINYLSIAIQANFLKNKIKNKDSLINKLNSLVPSNSTLQSTEVSIYQLDENSGLISKLPDYNGIPSDKNYLNNSLADGNRLFDSLLEIEEEI